jgi:hypothetical protein
MTYWRTALTMCRAAGVGPSLLLHPLDFMGCDDDQDLAFFPAMGRPAEPKIEVVSEMIDLMSRSYEIVPMREHAEAIHGTLKSLSEAREQRSSVSRSVQ